MSVEVTVREEDTDDLAGYATVSIAFRVEQILERDGERWISRAVAAPWTKDYDLTAGNHPLDLAARFDLTRWGVLSAWRGDARLGGALVAWNTPGVDMLEGRADLAVLWDLRVAARARGQGVGGALVEAVEAWARARACRELKVETQTLNAPACRFYARCGFAVQRVQPGAYADAADEVQVIWTKAL